METFDPQPESMRDTASLQLLEGVRETVGEVESGTEWRREEHTQLYTHMEV